MYCAMRSYSPSSRITTIPMHMIRHHHEFTDIHMRHLLRYRIPTPLRPFTDGRWMHHAIRDASEQMQPILRA
jgi:hypothetical protein